jgi:hypothetical protein
MNRTNRAVVVGASLLTGAAVVQQLRRPPRERTWQGRVLGLPYDLRPPTLQRIRATLWNPHNPSLLVPRAFGIGWSINLYRLLHRTTS